ncbi:MAG TPA: hypothetical protein VHK26_01560 [Methyloceanibacter sp.]|jgi:hypothetical protein|nr:hypothetical protein [Methyloceanibacter sp.]
MDDATLDAIISDVVDPLFADRFVKAVAKSLRGIHAPEQQEWLHFFLAGIRDRIEREANTSDLREFLAQPEPGYLDHLEEERHFAEAHS